MLDNLKVKLYITLDTLLESSDYNYTISENNSMKNKLLIESLSKISKEFSRLVDIVIVIKNDKCIEKCQEFIKNNINDFKYEIEIYKNNNDFIKSQKVINKTKTLIDTDDDLLFQWEKQTGKAIKYIAAHSNKSSWDYLSINGNFDNSEMYYNKFINYLHLYH